MSTTSKSLKNLATIYINEKLGFNQEQHYNYLIPEHLVKTVNIGSLVLVSFGKIDNIIGLVIDIIHQENSDYQGKYKEIKEVIPTLMQLNSKHLDFYQWIARQTCSSLASVIMTAYPFDLFSKLTLKVKLTDKGENNFYKTIQDTKNSIILNALKTEPLTIQTIINKTQTTKSELLKTLKQLKNNELVEIISVVDLPLKIKYQKEIELLATTANTAKEQAIYHYLKSHNHKAILEDLITDLKTTKVYIAKLVKENFLKINIIAKTKTQNNTVPTATIPELNDNQQTVFNEVNQALIKLIQGSPLANPDFHTNAWLLYGVTGSGKTMVYLKLIETCLTQNKNVLVLVPEISLTPSLINLLESYFPDRVHPYHSKLNANQRYETIKALTNDTPKIILGARSAILLPIDNLGLIIMDEEHDNSYKQTAPEPRYQTRDLCFELSLRHRALLLLVSATPDLITYYNFLAKNKILYLTKRFNNQVLPSIEYVDMRNELACGNKSILSVSLETNIRETLKNGDQVILLLNRRGYFSHVFCRACGYAVTCNNCSIDMVFHQNDLLSQNYNQGILICHHCGSKTKAIERCPKCNSNSIRHYGLGIQRVEETCRQSFPESKILRMDSDSISRKGSFEQILQDFSEAKANILIGTQLVAKGLNFPNVTLVGIILADSAFSFPDYRSMERGYQLLTQVAGRSGRAQKPGRVIMQTYNPELPIFNFIKNENFSEFAKYEIDIRQKFNYPPFTKLIRIISAHENSNLAEHELIKLAVNLGDLNHQEENFTVLGPAICPIAKLHNKSRFHLIIKIKDLDSLHQVYTAFKTFKKISKSNLALDASPVDLI